MSDPRHVLWTERFRPQVIADCILPESIKTLCQSVVDSGKVLNMLFSGSPGTGKTTAAKAICNELGLDCITINASMNNGIDTLRTEIKSFASTVSFNDKRKCVILDEADALTPQTQAALRNFMEEFSANCGMILTCNFKNKIIEPIHSRCTVIDFKIPMADKPKLASQFMKRVEGILEKEGIEYDKQAVAAVIMKYFPDWRRVLNELQRYAASGKIDSGILAGMGNESFDALVELVKNKKWKDMRKWVGENLDSEPNAILRRFYDTAYEHVVPGSIPGLVVLIADYQYKMSFSIDQEICLVAFLTQVMSEVEFK
jgi:DNA polymerase III delta prime subunit